MRYFSPLSFNELNQFLSLFLKKLHSFGVGYVFFFDVLVCFVVLYLVQEDFIKVLLALKFLLKALKLSFMLLSKVLYSLIENVLIDLQILIVSILYITVFFLLICEVFSLKISYHFLIFYISQPLGPHSYIVSAVIAEAFVASRVSLIILIFTDLALGHECVGIFVDLITEMLPYNSLIVIRIPHLSFTTQIADFGFKILYLQLKLANRVFFRYHCI